MLWKSKSSLFLGLLSVILFYRSISSGLDELFRRLAGIAFLQRFPNLKIGLLLKSFDLVKLVRFVRDRCIGVVEYLFGSLGCFNSDVRRLGLAMMNFLCPLAGGLVKE